MRLAVVGSINIDMTVTAERIPLKGEWEIISAIYQEEKVQIKQ